MQMSSLTKAYEDRGHIIKMMAGGALPGFAGTGLGSILRKGWSKIQPYAYSALKGALGGFSKGFSSSTSEDLGQKALAGLAEAGKGALANIRGQTGGGGLVSTYTGTAVPGTSILSTQESIPKKYGRPKLR